MTSARRLRRRWRRAMLRPRRRRFVVLTVGRFVTPHGTITHHEIPR